MTPAELIALERLAEDVLSEAKERAMLWPGLPRTVTLVSARRNHTQHVSTTKNWPLAR